MCHNNSPDCQCLNPHSLSPFNRNNPHVARRTLVLTVEVEAAGLNLPVGGRAELDKIQLLGALMAYVEASNDQPYSNAHIQEELTHLIRTYLPDHNNTGRLTMKVTDVGLINAEE